MGQPTYKILPTLAELRELPVLSQGATDDLKVEWSDGTDSYRTWLSRMTVEDGVEWDDEVTVERLIEGRWTSVYRIPGALLT
jgi:hypothetical protein